MTTLRPAPAPPPARPPAPDPPSAGHRDGVSLLLARWVFSPFAGVRFGDWARLMAEMRFAVSPCYWPRAAFTTLMSVMNSVCAAREHRQYAGAIDRMRVRDPVFVLGHHRSGTTHLRNLLGVDPRFASSTVLQAVFPHTMMTMERTLHGPASLLTPRRRPQDNVAFGPEAPVEEERAICASCFLSMQMGRHFPRSRDRFRKFLTMRDSTDEERETWKRTLDWFARKLLLRHGEDRTLLFKAPDHTGKIDLILELYPDARFIHIHRNPFEVFISTRRMEIDTVPLYAYQRLRPETLDDFLLWRYRAMYDAFFEARGRIPPGRFTEVAFEDIRADPLGQIERIYREVGLGAFDEVRPRLESYVESLSGYRMNRHPQLDPSLRARIGEAWAPSFDEWGYER